MVYENCMRTAANRHYEAAEDLMKTNRKDVAGYLYGLAAECAIKQAMLTSGMRTLPLAQRKDDPFYAHFESLKTLLRDNAHGRLKEKLRRIAESSSFMQYWDVTMRYSDGKTISLPMVQKWRDQALLALAMMDE